MFNQMNEKTKKYLDRIAFLNQRMLKTLEGLEELGNKTDEAIKKVEEWKMNLPEKKLQKK
jgi:hypothetical protein